MSIFEEGAKQAAEAAFQAQRATEARTGRFDTARNRIFAVNQQLPELARRLRDGGVAPEFTIGVPTYRNSGHFSRKMKIQDGLAGARQGWEIFRLTHSDPGGSSGMNSWEGSSYTRHLVLIPDGRVFETAYQSITDQFDPTYGLPPKFMYPEVESGLQYSFQLRGALQGVGDQKDPVALAVAFADMYESSVQAVVAQRLHG